MTDGLEERLREQEAPFLKWVKKNNSTLSRDYEGDYIAVLDEIVVDSDKNYSVLMKQVKERYPFFQPQVTNIPKG